MIEVDREGASLLSLLSSFSQTPPPTTTIIMQPPPPPSSSLLYILVIAHPDDESMFFVPTLRNLVRANQRVWIICLSNGNYNGLGRTREKEFMKACNILGVEQCLCINVLEDDPNIHWDAKTIATAINKTLDDTLQNNDSDNILSQLVILTFDQDGVSGHPNHVDTYRGVQYWLSTTFANDKTTTRGWRRARITGWKLDTVSNVFLKYIPLFWIPAMLYSYLLRQQQCAAIMHSMCLLFQPLLVWRAMAAHASQFVWYRRLSVLFSRYTYCNTWTEIENDAVETR